MHFPALFSRFKRFSRKIAAIFYSESKENSCSQCQKRQLIDPDAIWQYGIGDKMLYKKAQAGDTQAQFDVGCYFLRGENGFEQNSLKARDWLEKAARSGCHEAVSLLAEIK